MYKKELQHNLYSPVVKNVFIYVLVYVCHNSFQNGWMILIQLKYYEKIAKINLNFSLRE